ncbi:hypothetical protein AbraCBS73388_008960 [Aspergillus brasiliensis]|uniref:Involucrin repeat protein n=1 Tax=Aspergillus brasiliensis TaxID=319629 RepID=A0A9W5YS03_9EURO|nr:hypothetical protein AbraCBS73388_008960 [Aspergillus brasiliensis]
MFKALLGGGRSSSDVRSSSSSKSSSRRRTDSKSSTVSRKSSRGDDRDRGLGDLSNYRSSSSRSKRYAPSLAGESVASSYATADQGTPIEPDRVVIERAPRRQDSNDTTDRRDRYRDNGDGEGKSSRRRERARSPSRERERIRSDRDDRSSETTSHERDGDRRERQRSQSGDMYASPVTTGMPPSSGHFAAASPHTYPPVTEAMPTTSMPSPPHATTFYDPHVTQQFPGQFPTYVAEPYIPPNPAGEAADYYGDQGQSVQDQPGVRPKPPLVAASDQAHLMTASPTANPPPEPSSMGQVGAAAAYFMDDAELGMEQPEEPPSVSAPQPPKPSRPPRPSVQTAGISSPPAVATATTISGDEATDSPGHIISESPATYVPPTASSPPKPPHPHGGGAAFGAAAAATAGAAAGYMMSHHHQSASADHSAQYTMQNYEEVSPAYPAYPETPAFPPQQNMAPFAAGPAAAAAAAGYAASPLHPDHAAVYHGAPFQSGSLAFQQRQQGPLDKFINFWKDPEGVGMFEDYTETIGICKYCFEPGTTSQDAPRKHNHKPRRRSADRYSNGSRVDKASRYSSSEDEGRRRTRSSRNSWLPGLLGGYAVKSIFSSKEFDESYSVRTGEVASSRHSIHESEGASTAGRRSQTSRGVYRRSHRSRSREHTDHSSYHSDSKLSRYEGSRLRSRSRSRSSSRSQRHAALRNAALGVAVGSATASVYESRHRSRSRSTSSRGRRSRKTSSSDESFVDISRPARKTVGSGFSSFFTASSENRRKRRTKRRKSIFSFSNNNSSSSSLDADLAFGSGYTKRQSGKSNRRSKKKADTDVDAALLGLGAAATALAASSRRGNRRTGEILAGKESRSGRSDYESSAANDEGWEDLDSGDQSSSSVTSGLAFGESGHFPSTDSHSSDSGTSRWPWRWGTKKSKKKQKKRRSRSSENRFPAETAVAAGLGTAALASAYHRDSKVSSHDAESSTGSLQHVAPVPTSDPSHFDAIKVSSQPPSQPTLVRPGPIPLQQPQPVTPVSQAVYSSQGESIPSYSAPNVPYTPESAFMPYETPSTSDRWNQRSADYAERSDISSRINRAHRRSDSSPVFHAEPLERMSTSSFRRRSTLKDQASVQFDLTEEQANKERRANRLESLRREAGAGEGVRLVDREQEMALRDAERRASQQREREFEKSRIEEESSRRGNDSSSLMGAAAVGALTGVAAATVLSGRSSNDDSETASQRRHEERREKRRAERRRVSESESIASSLPMSDSGRTVPDESSQIDRLPEDVRPRPSRPLPHAKPVYEDYAQFFAPEELRYSPDTYARREPTSMPTIIEVEPATEPAVVTEEPHPDYNGLPWPVPGLTLTGPTPPHSQVGSARATPIILIPERHEEENKFERQTTGSRVSWGKHETHEYEVPSTSSEHESVDQDTRVPEHIEDVEPSIADAAREMPPSSSTQTASKGAPSMVGADIEFAAALAAATAAAGFDPSLVTDDPTFHTRSSPPTTEPKVQFVSPWEEASVPRTVPHGFVEGEVETPDDDENIQMAPEYRIEDGPLFSEPEPRTVEQLANGPRQSIAQEVIEHLSRRKERNVSDSPAIQPGPEPASKGVSDIPVEVLSMPGGFEPEESTEGLEKPRVLTSTQERDSPSFVSAPGTQEDGPSPTRDTPQQSSGDIEPNDDDIDPSAIGTDGGEGKKKRRKRRSKRGSSDNFEDAVSITSSPARLGEKTKETKSGGFLSNLFGSRVSAPVEDEGTSFADKHSSREVQSEIGSGRRERSSRRRSSGRGDGLDDESRKQDDEENINVEHYKSSRQRREERRRQRYEDMMESGKSSEFEKDQEQVQNDEQQSFLEEGPGMPAKVDEGDAHRGASGRQDPEITGLGLDVLDSRLRSRSASPPASEKTANPVPTSQSRPTSPELARSQEENQGERSRRSSVLRSTESPTAVPLHFRRPPTSPRANRSPSVSSVVAPSPGSPTQNRRRPASTEFKNSREIRPLWLVERFGASKSEPHPDEPLPSLPSSKTSSANASVEDLAALPDVKQWEMVDLSEHVQGSPRVMAVETSAAENQPSDEASYDFLDSQQGTPTAASFGQTAHHPPLRKEKLKYEFHSPSELLQDISVHQELPPSPEIGPLPSAEGSAVGVKDEMASERVVTLPSLPEIRPSTPEDKVLLGEDAAETTPTQTRNDFAKHETITDVGSGVDAVTGHDDIQLDSQRSEEQVAPEKGQRIEEGEHIAETTASEGIPVQIPTSDVAASDKDRTIESAHESAPVGVATMVGTAVAAVAGSVMGKPDQIEEPQPREIDQAKGEMGLPMEPDNVQADVASNEKESTPVVAGTDSQDVPKDVAPAPTVDEPVQGETGTNTFSTTVNTGAETKKHDPEQVSAEHVADASHSVPGDASKAFDDIVEIPAEPRVESERQENSAPHEKADVECPETSDDPKIAIQSEEPQVDVLTPGEVSSEAKEESAEAATGDINLGTPELTPANTEKHAGESTQDQAEELGVTGPEATSIEDTPAEVEEPEREKAPVGTDAAQEVPASNFAGPTESNEGRSLPEKAPEAECQEPEPIKTEDAVISSEPPAEATGDAINEPLDRESEEPVGDISTPSTSKKKKNKKKKKGKSVDLDSPETTPASDEPTRSLEEQNAESATEPAITEQAPEPEIQESGLAEPAVVSEEIATETAPLPTATEAGTGPDLQETAPTEQPAVTAEPNGETTADRRDDEKLAEVETRESVSVEQPALSEGPGAEIEKETELASQEVPTPGDIAITDEASAEINKPTEQDAQEPQLVDQAMPEESLAKAEGLDHANLASAAEQPAEATPQDMPSVEEPSSLQEESVLQVPKKEETTAILEPQPEIGAESAADAAESVDAPASSKKAKKKKKKKSKGASQDLTAEEAAKAEDAKPSEESTAVDKTEVAEVSEGLEAAQLAEEAIVEQTADTSEQPEEVETERPFEGDTTDNKAEPIDETVTTQEATGVEEDSKPSEEGVDIAKETSQATAAEPDVSTAADVSETSPADNIPVHATETTDDTNNFQLPEETVAPTESDSAQMAAQDNSANVEEPNENEVPALEHQLEELRPSAEAETTVAEETSQELIMNNEAVESEPLETEDPAEQLQQDETQEADTQAQEKEQPSEDKEVKDVPANEAELQKADTELEDSPPPADSVKMTPEPAIIEDNSQEVPEEPEASLSRKNSKKKKKNKRKSATATSLETEATGDSQPPSSAEVVSEAQATPGPEFAPEEVAIVEAGAAPEPGPGPEVAANAEAASETEAAPATEAAAETESGLETEVAAKDDATPETVAAPEHELAPETEPAAKTDTATETEAATVSETVPESTVTGDESPELKLPDEACNGNKEYSSHVADTESNELKSSEGEKPEPGDLAGETRELQPEEPVEEQPKKKNKKKKKNRKSTALDETEPELEREREREPEPEAEPKQPGSSQEDSAESPLLQTSGELPSAAQQNNEASEEVVAEPLADATVSDSTLPVEQTEANDQAPHVPDQSAVEPAPELDPESEAGSSTPTGKKSKKNKKKKRQSLPATPDESLAPVEPSLDNTVPVVEPAELPVAAEGSAPTEHQQEQEETVLETPPIGATEPPVEQAIEAPPMTAAQKKKAKKEKKKQQKQQAESADITPAPEPEAVAVPEDAPPEDLAPEEPQVDLPTNENLEASEGLASEQSKDAPTGEETPAITIGVSSSGLCQGATVPSGDDGPENTEFADTAKNQHPDPTRTDAEPQNLADGVSKPDAYSTEDQPQDAVDPAPLDEPSKDIAEPTDLPEGYPQPNDDEPVTEAHQAQEGQAGEAGTAENDASPDKNIDVEPAVIEATIPQDDVATSVEAPTEQAPAGMASISTPEQGRAEQDTAADADQEEPAQEDTLPTSSTKSKKDKKKKKKRQSVSLDESQPALAQGDDGSEVLPEAGSAPTDTPEEVSSFVVAEKNDTSENSVPEPPADEPKELGNASSEPAEPIEPAQDTQEPSKSKKKAKKDKKKRKSVSFADEESAPQPTESSDSAADAFGAGQQDDEPMPTDDAHAELSQDSHDTGLRQSQEAEPASEEPTGEAPVGERLDLPDEGQATVMAANGLEDAAQHPSEPVTEERIEGSEEPATLLSNGVDFAEETPNSNSVEDAPFTSKETAEENEPEAVTMTTETTEQLQPEASPETTDAQPSAREADPQSVNTTAEQDGGSSKSKKKKKKKKKSVTADANEDTGADDGPSEPVTPIEPGTPAEPELFTESETPIEPQTPLEPEAAVEPETVVEPETPVDATVPALHESEVVASQPGTSEKDAAPMSAKAKKKAKKDKKRQSKNLADATEPADETHPSSDAQAPSETKTAEKSLETANIPAEDDGKENQSHGTEHHGENDKDLIWTDDMVSPQVEQEQATSSAYPLQREHEKSEDEPVSIPSDKVLKPIELDANISSQDKLLSVDEPEESGDAHGKPDTQPAESKVKLDEGTGQMSVEEQGESSTYRHVVEDVAQDVVEEKEQAPAEEGAEEGAEQEDEQTFKKEELLRISPEKEQADEVTETRVGEVIPPETMQQGESVEGAVEMENSAINVPSKKKSKKEKKKKRQAEEAASQGETEQGVAVTSHDEATAAVIPEDLPVETAAPSTEPGSDESMMPTVPPMNEEPAADDLEAVAPAESHGEESGHLNEVPVESILDACDRHLDIKTIVQAEKDILEGDVLPEDFTPEAAEGEAAVDVAGTLVEPVAKPKKNKKKKGPSQGKEETEHQEVIEPGAESEVVPGNELVGQKGVMETTSEQALESTEHKNSVDAVQDGATLSENVDEPAVSSDKPLEPTSEAPEGLTMESEKFPPDDLVRNEDNVTSPVAESTADFPSGVAQQETNEVVLTRKESKKRKKKAKKQARDEQNSPTLVPVEGAVAADEGTVGWTDTLDSTSPPVEESGNTIDDKQRDTPTVQDDGEKKQHQTPQIEEEPVRSAEEFQESLEVSTAERQDMVVQQKLETTNAEQDAETLTEKHHLAMAEELSEKLWEQPEAPAPLARKLSKKERRKAKQRAEQELVEAEEEQQPEVDAGASADPNPVQEQVTEAPDALAAEQAKVDDVSLGLHSGEEEEQRQIIQTLDVKDPEGEQPHKKDATSFPPQKTEIPAWEQRAQDDDSWPIIDWEKSEVDATGRSPDSSPEARAVPFEPGIAEFDENAIPEGVIRHPSASAAARKSTAGASHRTESNVIQDPSDATNVPPVSPSTALHVEHSIYGKSSSESLGLESQKQSKVASIFPELERGFFRRPALIEPSESAKDGAEEETIDKEAIRDSAIVLEAPITTTDSPSSGQDDAKTATEPTQVDETRQPETGLHSSPNEPTIEVEADTSYNVSVLSDGPEEDTRQTDIRWEEQKDKESPREVEAETAESSPSSHHEAPLYAPSPVHERQSVLVRSGSPSGREIGPQMSRSSPTCELRRSPSIHGRHNHPRRPWSLEVDQNSQPRTPSPQPTGVDREAVSPPRTPLQTIEEDEPRGRTERSTGSRTVGHGRGTPRLEMKPEHVLPRPVTPTRKFTDNALARQAWPTPDKETPFDENADVEVKKRRPDSRLVDGRWPAEVLKTPEQDKPILRPSSSIRGFNSMHNMTPNLEQTPTPRSLRRSHRNASGDLRAAATQAQESDDQSEPKPQPPASSASDLNLERIASSSSYDPVTDKGKRPLRNMTDVYEGWGETPSSPRSPSRPPSVRHRRSMQHLQELESRLDRLISENRLLAAAREEAEDKLRKTTVARRKSDHALNSRDADLRDRDAEVEQLKSSLEWLQKEVARLTEENTGLTATTSNLTATHAQEVQVMQETFDRQVDELRSENQQLSAEMHDRVRQEVEMALAQKDMELRRLREELENARDKVKQLQQQIAAAMQDDVLVFRDEDYFDAACQKLCGHVQQWVLRFSKHSDHRRCRKLSDLQDEKIADRFDNAILDGSDADTYLADRVRRRDVFMSVVMTMVWEFIFTRYLFGMDREQRQKLKSLEKQLADIGPRSAIHRWRATTLTLLSKRPTFSKQRESDTEAVALEIFDTLSRLLPPPTNVEAQLLDSLRKVLRVAVHLSIEMRTQLAEYIMLPPLQPEYDTNGDLARQVYFNASLMNERSGETTSNEELETQQAVVRVVLFPLVVKKGNDRGEGDDEVVVCPAQVLIARPNKDKKVTKMLSGDRMSLDATRSVHSVAPSSTMDMSNVI